MITFLLHGGKTSQENPQNTHFFRLFTELVNKDKVTVLLCYFARERDTWQDLIDRNTSYIKNGTKKEVEILVAKSPADLLQKLDLADVLYVAGGESKLIEPLYKDLGSLSEKLDGKVYAGSSMGAFMASTQYVLSADEKDVDGISEGLGLLPIQILCHWNMEPEKEKKIKLLNMNSNNPVLVLNEFETVVIYK